MSSKMDPKIVIVGASVSGLTLALSLLHHAKSSSHSLQPSDVVILEARSADAKPGGPVSLTPNSLRLIDRLGIYDKVQAQGFLHTNTVFRDGNGDFKGHLPHGDAAKWGYKALRIQRATLLDVLKKEVQASSIRIEYDSSLREVISENGSGVTYRVRIGSGDVVERTAEMLIGCDGVHSKTRAFILGDLNPLPEYIGTVMIAGKSRTSKMKYISGFEEAGANDERVMSIMTSRGAWITIPSDPAGEEQLMARQYPMPDRDRAGWERLDADKELLHGMLMDGIEAMPKIVQSSLEQAKPEDMYIWAVHTIPKLRRWVSEGHRAGIIGDAAHAMIPAAAQGANQAIEDAYTLAKVLSTSSDLDKTLDAWQAKRMERVEKVKQMAKQLMNSRLPVEKQQELSREDLFDVSGTKEERDGRFTWLYGWRPDDDF